MHHFWPSHSPNPYMPFSPWADDMAIRGLAPSQGAIGVPGDPTLAFGGDRGLDMALSRFLWSMAAGAMLEQLAVRPDLQLGVQSALQQTNQMGIAQGGCVPGMDPSMMADYALL